MHRVGMLLLVAPLIFGCSKEAEEKAEAVDGGTTDQGLIHGTYYQIKTASNEGGALQPQSLLLPEGGKGVFALTVESGYQLLSVSGCGGAMTDEGFVVEGIQGDCTVRAHFAERPIQIQTETSEGGVLSPQSRSLKRGETGRFEPMPDIGYELAEISGCGGSLQGAFYETGPATDDCTVVASFAVKTGNIIDPPAPPGPGSSQTPLYLISTQSVGGGTLYPQQQEIESGQQAIIQPIPEAGHHMTAIEGCNGTLEVDGFITAPVNQNCTVTASFARNQYRIVTDLNTGGSIRPTHMTLNHGDVGEFVVSANPGFQVASVSGCAGSLLNGVYTVGAINESCTIDVRFSPVQYQIATAVGEGGSIQPTQMTLSHGDTGEFVVSAEAGYQVASVTGCEGSLLNGVYTVGAINQSCTIDVRFSPVQYQIATAVGEGGSIQPTQMTLSHGDTGAFVVSAEPEYQVASVSGCEGSLLNGVYTTGPISESCSIDVRFSPVQYQVSTEVGEGGSISPAQLQVDSGQRGVFTLSPQSGYAVDAISGCGGTLTEGRYQTDEVLADCTVSVSFLTNAQNAIKHADHRLASEQELIDHLQAAIAQREQKRKATVRALFSGLETISWFPSHDAVHFTSYLPDTTWPLLRSNTTQYNSASNVGLVMVHEKAQQRWAAMASSLFSVGRNEGTDTLLKRLLGWLTRGEDAKEGFRIVAAHVPRRADDYWFPHYEGMVSWLNAHYPDAYQVNGARECDGAAFSGCIDESEPDLIVLGGFGNADAAVMAEAIEKAKALSIPILTTNYFRSAGPILSPLYQEMGLTSANNYWSKHRALDLNVEALLLTDETAVKAMSDIVRLLEEGKFDTEAIAGCTRNFLSCNSSGFRAAFRFGADHFRRSVTALDAGGINLFGLSSADIVQAGVLLADKYRSNIDYPITRSEGEAWLQALFADWAVNYARPNNQAQPDLGEYVIDKRQVRKQENAHYEYPEVTQSRRQISVPYPNQWTTTGWYALPGQTVTLTRHDDSDAVVKVRLNYHRGDTHKAHKNGIYNRPLELTTQRLTLAKQSSVTLSSPYGGPIYLHLSGSGTTLTTDVTASGIVHHPSIRDFNDSEQIAAFQQAMESTQIPHLDLRSEVAEHHMRRDKFTSSIGSRFEDVGALLTSIRRDHINSVYSLAGFKIPGMTLADSLPTDVKSVCLDLLGEDCIDNTLHVRRIIQHANYDQYSLCGSGCSGNPWDASWSINPLGWGDNHELGHNLQVPRLNVHYAPAEDANRWGGYSSRAGENSNNIFPYYVYWHHHYIQEGNTSIRRDTHSNQKELFFAFMSDVLQRRNGEGERVVFKNDSCSTFGTGDRYQAPWESNTYAIHNGYRMTFYLQMALRAHGLTMASGTKLNNGFGIYTLLYLHSRIFGRYAANQQVWEANRNQLGFSLFPYQGHEVYGGRKIKDIPGNDFMLVSLSHLTGLDWRSHFDLLGLRYTTLASQQVQANATAGALRMGMYVLDTDLPPANMTEGLDFLPLSMEDSTTVWPRDNSSPAQCGNP